MVSFNSADENSYNDFLSHCNQNKEGYLSYKSSHFELELVLCSWEEDKPKMMEIHHSVFGECDSFELECLTYADFLEKYPYLYILLRNASKIYNIKLNLLKLELDMIVKKAITLRLDYRKEALDELVLINQENGSYD